MNINPCNDLQLVKKIKTSTRHGLLVKVRCCDVEKANAGLSLFSLGVRAHIVMALALKLAKMRHNLSTVLSRNHVTMLG